jgi:F-type H+-transporting ATPase subunit delta
VSYETIGRRYARAIFEIGKETGSLDSLAREIGSFADTYAGSEELRDALDNPLVPDEQREAILVDIAKRLALGETAQRALRVLLQNRRLLALPDVSRQLAKLVDEDGKILRAHVTGAAALSDGYLARLKAELERSTGRRVVLTTSVDPSLIAGVVTRVGDKVIDGSVRARLSSFRDSISPQGTAFGS